MAKALPDHVSEYFEKTHRGDKVVADLMKKLEAHIGSKSYENRLDAMAENLLDTKEPPKSFYDTVKDPSSFTKGFNQIVELVDFYFDIAHKAGFNKADIKFLHDSIKDKMLRVEEDVAVRDDISNIVRLSATMVQMSLIPNIERLEDQIEEQLVRVDEMTSDAYLSEKKRLVSVHDELNEELKAYYRDGTLPANLEVTFLFANDPGGQLEYNVMFAQADVDKFQENVTRNVDLLANLQVRLAALRKEHEQLQERKLEFTEPCDIEQ